MIVSGLEGVWYTEKSTTLKVFYYGQQFMSYDDIHSHFYQLCLTKMFVIGVHHTEVPLKCQNVEL